MSRVLLNESEHVLNDNQIQQLLTEGLFTSKSVSLGSGEKVMLTPYDKDDNVLGNDKPNTRLNKFISFVKAKYKTRYPRAKFVSDEVLTNYKKIDHLLRNNIEARNVARDRTIAMDIYNIRLHDAKRNKYYLFQYTPIYINYEYVQNSIKNAMDMIQSSGSKNYDILAQAEREVHFYLHDNFDEILATKIVMTKSTKVKGTIEQHIENIRVSSDQLYLVVANEVSLLGNENTYAMVFQKSYHEVCRIYSSDKKAMEYIDKMYNNCIDYIQKAIEWNFEGLDKASMMLGYYYCANLETIIDLI